MILLIGGHMGSGKSVLQRTLHNPPKIIILEAFYCFANINVTYSEHVKGLKSIEKRRNFRSAGARWGYAQYLLLLRARTLFSRFVRLNDIEGVLKQIFPRAVIIGDSANRYLEHLDRTVNLAGTKHVIIYRDCRDVAAEMKRRSTHSSFEFTASARKQQLDLRFMNPQQTAKRWLKMINLMEAHQEKIYPICYEELVSVPLAVLSPLAQWFGISADLVQHNFLHTDNIGNYRHILTEKEVADVMDIASPAMERLGYP